jgi:thiamine-phosphate pyrophosphorylase
LADDSPRWKLDPVEQAEAACAGGAAVVQLRVKQTGDRQAIAWGTEIRRATSACGVLFVVNDRFDLALVLGADGVHLGQDDLPPARIPASARRQLQIGLSTHTLEQVRASRDEPIDYVAFGPVFDTGSKISAYDARGLSMLREAVALASPYPLVAIGGIDAGNSAEILRAGATGIAIISFAAGADDPSEACRQLAASMRSADSGRE